MIGTLGLIREMHLLADGAYCYLTGEEWALHKDIECPVCGLLFSMHVNKNKAMFPPRADDIYWGLYLRGENMLGCNWLSAHTYV